MPPPLPGFELNHHGLAGPSGPRGQEFLQGFNAHDQGFSDAWDEAMRPGFVNGLPMGPEAAHFEDFERIYSQQGPMLPGTMPEGKRLHEKLLLLRWLKSGSWISGDCSSASG